MQSDLETAAVETFAVLEVREDGVELEGIDLRGPSSTWTYLVNDDPFRDALATALGGRAGVGAGAAARAGPIWIASALWQHWWRKRRGRQ